jgi:glucose-6-phosphate isomerase
MNDTHRSRGAHPDSSNPALPADGRVARLQAHARRLQQIHLRELIPDEARQSRLQCQAGPLHADFSRQRMDADALNELLLWAQDCDIDGARKRLADGSRVNFTEGRAAVHPALRGPYGPESVREQAAHERRRMAVLVQALRSGQITGYTGAPIQALVCLGIGGSDLGPRLVSDALAPDGAYTVRYAANVDPRDLGHCLHGLHPDTTAFAVVSKTFTTRETLANAAAARAWLRSAGCPPDREAEHFIGITAAPAAARAWGIRHEHLLQFDEGVGGRYSLWSTVGFGAAVACGMPVFDALLEGACGMDAHFFEQAAPHNLPVLMGLISVWNRSFMKHGSLAVLPYAERLSLLPAWLQQLVMESNGKTARADGIAAERSGLSTAPVIWGACGTTAQHSFLQQLHQGPEAVPTEFILLRSSEGRTARNDERQRILLANALAQAAALAIGQTRPVGRAMGPADATDLSAHQDFPGNRPSTLLLLHDLSAQSLGALLACYEHATFTAATLLGINPFDQFGVELGKRLALSVEQALIHADGPHGAMSSQAGLASLDASTRKSLERLL